ncbi:Exosome complex exonuclease RRP40, putative [Perkinsus marinus ATCC 50983]|uniref:Ribosomal RNA-processing protein 40 n=1 Tax=Perkinsus marinus (strain ATCC 50983 / TXsc) TaxID=423536 RepID=C5KZ91_PERM5|nr:Exosome complex exonuclease RRP40, putative [Perkinsus marinus ATCC 50983]EER10241.1 Exosome complex exonuclease RRP40, putative [Perkinsus marinus ATCC 50983]|eukprot:XP_002778446.1 Exosome complex exonuclease RRP40, putative [Perkinsus marinus ATCC 50983]
MAAASENRSSASVHVYLPGDTVSIEAGVVSSCDPNSVGFGIRLDEDCPKAAVAGLLSVESAVSDIPCIDNTRKRYIPRRGDMVLGVVVQRTAEYYRVDINGPTGTANLPTLAFNGATKRHKPNLSPGDLVYCHVTVADRDLDVELSCVDPSTTRDWTHKDVYFGHLAPVDGCCGLQATVPLWQAKSLQATNSTVMASLGRHFVFESAIGVNGRCWISAAAPNVAVMVSRILSGSHKLSQAHMEAMCSKMAKQLA